MKKLLLVVLSMAFLSGLAGCSSRSGSQTNPTGYPSGEVQRQQVMYDGIVYIYTANGFDNPLPNDYTLVGEVKAVDNSQEPAEDWCGSRVDIGQKIYASDDASVIYLEYESGYAEFVDRGAPGIVATYEEAEDDRNDQTEETTWYHNLPTASTAEELFGTHQFATERDMEGIPSGKEIILEELISSAYSVRIPYNGRSAFVDIIAKIDDNAYADVTSVVDWQSEDNEVAYAYDGRIMATGQGDTTVKASLAGVEVVIHVTVENHRDLEEDIER